MMTGAVTVMMPPASLMVAPPEGPVTSVALPAMRVRKPGSSGSVSTASKTGPAVFEGSGTSVTV